MAYKHYLRPRLCTNTRCPATPSKPGIPAIALFGHQVACPAVAVAYTKTDVYYWCSVCEIGTTIKHGFSTQKAVLPPLWALISGESGDFFLGPFLLVPAKPKNSVAVPELFTLQALQQAVMQHPKGWSIRQQKPTNAYPLPYTSIRFGQHGLWLARGLAVDVLWSQWKEAR